MLHPILLMSAKVPNDLEIYPTFNVEQNTSPTFYRVGLKELGIRANIDNEYVRYSLTALTSRWGWNITIYPKDSTEKQRTFGLFTKKQQNDVNNSVYVREAEIDGLGSYKLYYIATQNWVNEQISGAIATSY